MDNQDFIEFDIPKRKTSIIKVFGVGGCGSSAVNTMYINGIKDVDFYILNTDVQDFDGREVPNKIQLGVNETEGLGAGNNPEKGRAAAIESLDIVHQILEKDTKMLFVTAGMGGGTGTGAAPVIAKESKEMGILTVAIVTFPIPNEGPIRINQALKGIEEIKQYVDSLLIINNQRIFDIYGNLAMEEANQRGDEILTIAVKGIAEIITLRGSINVDFADVESIMRDSGVALMCNGKASGENRIDKALKEALNSPLLNDNDIHGSENILVNITYNEDGIKANELGKVLDTLQNISGNSANLIYGIAQDKTLTEEISITIIATGFNSKDITDNNIEQEMEQNLNDENLVNEFIQGEENEKVTSIEDMHQDISALEDQPAISRANKKMIQGTLFNDGKTEEQRIDETRTTRYTISGGDKPEIDENPYFDKKID
ncbi:MAG TPA: cell division protein FtsZ [Bacteroidales bacterium]|nr:cell division protein FtsZ [Bacteroidales bacterium]